MVADLFSLLAQTASPKGKPGKGALRRALLQRGKPRKERKTAEALERAKRGKGWCGGWGRPLQSACADSFPEGGSRERANCAEHFYRGGNRGVGTGKAGKRLVRRLEQTSSVCLRRQLPRRGSRDRANCAERFPEGGSRERANCAERFYREENRERNERQPWRWKGQSREDRNDSAACGHKNR